MNLSPLYWVYSPEGPTKEQFAFGHHMQGGVLGPVSQEVAFRFEALGCRAVAYEHGATFTGFVFDAPGVPGWSAVFSPSAESANNSTAERPAFSIEPVPETVPKHLSDIDPNAVEWPDRLPENWLLKLKRYETRTGERRR